MESICISLMLHFTSVAQHQLGDNLIISLKPLFKLLINLSNKKVNRSIINEFVNTSSSTAISQRTHRLDLVSKNTQV